MLYLLETFIEIRKINTIDNMISSAEEKLHTGKPVNRELTM